MRGDIMTTTKIYDIKEAIKAQRDYCNRRNVPHFAPFDGICYSCGANIYGPRGISVEEAGARLISGCPFCHASYVD